MGNTIQTITYEGASAEVFCFDNGSEVREYHVMIHARNPLMTFAEQAAAVAGALRSLRADAAAGAKTVFKRYFLSDASNQSEQLAGFDNGEGACSVIQQAPLDGTKIALWAYLMTGVETARSDVFAEAVHGGFRHLWCGSRHVAEGNSEHQAGVLLDDYARALEQSRCRLADNCVRTWFFVNDIDLNYGGMVRARNEVFGRRGLTRDTHYIASTGIAGRQARAEVLVQMDAYAIDGVNTEQMEYLYAASHLNRTSDYGVSFERGTAVLYGDRRQIFISGTASIDNCGRIMHAGDVVKQAGRMMENVETLLAEGGATFEDVGAIIVYLRDPSDYLTVRALCAERFAGRPLVIVNAAVCRPGWLIEMECMAVNNRGDRRFPNF